MKKILPLISLVIAASLLIPGTLSSASNAISSTAPGPLNFEARMSGTQEVPPVVTSGHGFFTATLNEAQTELTFTLNVFDLDLSRIFAAHIHVGPFGVNGPVILFLYDRAREGTWVNPRTGTLTAANLIPRPGATTFAEFVSSMLAGGTYANAHTTEHPGGEVRGQIGLSANIDVKPGSDPNSINVRSSGVIPVAILTTSTVDAGTVDPSTVKFGRFGFEAAPAVVPSSLEDVDGDGDLDRVLLFNVRETGIRAGDAHATLTGKTFGGTMISGTDSVRAFFPGDVNGDLMVNVVDLALVGAAFLSVPGSSNWNLYADFDENGIINVVDLSTVGRYFGQHA